MWGNDFFRQTEQRLQEAEHRRIQEETYGTKPEEILLLKSSFSREDLQAFNRVWKVIRKWSYLKIDGAIAGALEER